MAMDKRTMSTCIVLLTKGDFSISILVMDLLCLLTEQWSDDLSAAPNEETSFQKQSVIFNK